jgi:hypothetical protein
LSPRKDMGTSYGYPPFSPSSPPPPSSSLSSSSAAFPNRSGDPHHSPFSSPRERGDQSMIKRERISPDSSPHSRMGPPHSGLSHPLPPSASSIASSSSSPLTKIPIPSHPLSPHRGGGGYADLPGLLEMMSGGLGVPHPGSGMPRGPRIEAQQGGGHKYFCHLCDYSGKQCNLILFNPLQQWYSQTSGTDQRIPNPRNSAVCRWYTIVVLRDDQPCTWHLV